MPQPSPTAVLEALGKTALAEADKDEHATPESARVPRIPDDGICPHCLKMRGHVKEKWTLLPSFVGCKYCFRKFIPETEARNAWAAKQRIILKRTAGAQQDEQSQSSFEQLRADILDLKTICLGIQAELTRMRHKPDEYEGSSTPECLLDLPSVDDHPGAIKMNIQARLAVSPDELSVDERMRIGRPCCGYELKRVFGDRLNSLYEAGSTDLISSPRGFILPAIVIQRWNEPTASMRERIAQYDIPDEWEDAASEWFAHNSPQEYATHMWEELNCPVLALEDYKRYGWEQQNAK